MTTRMLKAILRRLTDSRGVSLYEITAAVAMTGILAAVALPVIIDRISEAKAARAVQEADGIYRAMTAFQRDTGRMPGEAEVLADGSTTGLLVSDIGGPLPDAAPGALDAASVMLDGNNVCAKGCLDINDYLVRKPDTAKYPNWRGPYMDEIKNDPFDRVYIVNVRALVKAEPPGVNNFGYGWVLSGGPDRRLDTKLTDTRLNGDSDDIGKNNGKKVFIPQ